ncbi:MAG: aspartate aminotransferase family protein [Candidatus Leucobacter sulfamidivorax]|nr:aspartate aminotransferase family protein [Candidatus Leucobacter sulfamidivorax]
MNTIAAELRWTASEAYHQRACEVLPRGVTSAARAGGSPFPIAFERARGARIWDIDGNEYIDLVGGFGPAILGHLPPNVVSAVRLQIDRGVIFGGQHPGELELAELIRAAVPCAEMVTLCNSGTEGVQTALRIARATTGRQLILAFDGHYHGWIDPVSPPNDAGSSANARADRIVIEWGEMSKLDAVMELYGDQLAAVIIEPFPCNQGVFRPTPGYLARIREWCDRTGALLIFDEVISGFRVALGGAQSLVEVTPDLTVLAKGLAAGFPLAAVCGTRAAFSAARGDGPLKIGGTYNGQALGVAAAIRAVQHLRDEEKTVYAQLEGLGRQLEERISAAATETGRPLTVNRIGSILQLFYGLDAPAKNVAEMRRSDAAALTELTRGLLSRGVYALPRGLWFVSAMHSSADIDRIGDALVDALTDLPAGGRE